MPLKEIQCVKEKANILPLPTLPYDESEISETIDILRELIQRLSLDNYVFEDKIYGKRRLANGSKHHPGDLSKDGRA